MKISNRIHLQYRKSGLIVLISVLAATLTFAQGPKPSDPPPAVESGVVRGVVHDSTTNGGIEYATVGLYRVSDSSFVNGVVTDQAGTFLIKGIPAGNYYLETSFLGYQKRRIPVNLDERTRSVNLGLVTMHPDMTHIEAVQVVAQSQRVEYKIDKKVVNVAQDLSASGGTLVNVLENTPSVQVDVEGNVTLRGSGNFRLLIDGKPSVIQGSEGLQQIPASAVQNLEIITSPSAKYDPDGDAGIINVIMKKQKNTGIGGVINASIGTREKYTADFLLNFRKNKINYYLGAEFADQKNFMEGKADRRTYGDTSTYQITSVNGMFNRKSYNVKTGFDYSLTDKSTLSLSGALNNRTFNRDFSSLNHFYTLPATADSFYRENNSGGDNSLFYNLNMDYITKFDDKGHNLKASVYYSSGKGEETEEDQIRKTDAQYVVTGQQPARTRSRMDEPESNLRMELDYTRPMGTNKLEAGLQSRWENSDGDYIFEDYQPIGNEWTYNDTISNSLTFRNAMQSAYTTFNGHLGKFDYQTGLRLEYDDRRLEQLTSNESFTYQKFHLFPSFFVTRKLSDKHQLQFTYSRRIQRPGKWELNPFIEYRGASNVFYGNPGLKPQFTNAFELNYQYSLKKGFISLETYYRVTNDVITRINGTQELNGRQVFFNTSINGDRDQSLGVELMVNTEPAKWLQLNLTGNLFRYQLDGQIDGQSVTSVSTTWRTNYNTTFILGKNTRFQVSGFYNGPSNTLQGKREGFIVTNMALRQDLLKKQLTVSLNARDIFATGKFAFMSQGDSFYTSNRMQREAPVVTLNLSYRLNNYKQAGRRGGENEDQGNQMDMGM